MKEEEHISIIIDSNSDSDDIPGKSNNISKLVI